VGVNGGAGVNQLLVSNAGRTTADTTFITANAMSFMQEALGFFYQATGGTFSNITVEAGSGPDALVVQSQLANTPLSVFGNGGNDAFTVDVNNSSAYQNLLVDGGPDSNTLDIVDQGTGGSVHRQASSSTSGVFQVTYTSGATSSINYANLQVQLSNDAIQ
jgi:hypothetical protein